MKDPWTHRLGPMLVIGLGAAGIVFAIVMWIREARDWDRFKEQKHCTIIRRIDGSSGVGFGQVNGEPTTIVTTTSARVVWRCDDGMEYEKEE